MADEPRKPDSLTPSGDDRKAELRSRLFVTKANDKEIPVPPKPPRPRPQNDAPLLGYVALAFLLLAVVTAALSRVIPYNGPTLNPFECMSVLSFSAAGVMGIWAWYKSTGIDLSPIEPDEYDGQ
jgi:hypothetical protein